MNNAALILATQAPPVTPASSGAPQAEHSGQAPQSGEGSFDQAIQAAVASTGQAQTDTAETPVDAQAAQAPAASPTDAGNQVAAAALAALVLTANQIPADAPAPAQPVIPPSAEIITEMGGLHANANPPYPPLAAVHPYFSGADVAPAAPQAALPVVAEGTVPQELVAIPVPTSAPAAVPAPAQNGAAVTVPAAPQPALVADAVAPTPAPAVAPATVAPAQATLVTAEVAAPAAPVVAAEVNTPAVAATVAAPNTTATPAAQPEAPVRDAGWQATLLESAVRQYAAVPEAPENFDAADTLATLQRMLDVHTQDDALLSSQDNDNHRFNHAANDNAGNSTPAAAFDPSGNRIAPSQAHAFSKFLDASRQESPADQVSVQFRAMTQSGASSIKIQLHPADLGKVEVQMSMAADGKTTVTVTADNRNTLQMLQQGARQLEQALRDVGLKADAGSLSFNLRGEQQPYQQQKFASADAYTQAAALDDTQQDYYDTLTHVYRVRAGGGVDIRV